MRVGDVVALTSLITNKTIQFNHHTKELDANGGARFFWEVVKSIRNKPDTTVVQLQSLHSRRFIHVAHDFIVETTTVTSVACDLKVHEMPNQCVALEFLSYPGCFLGFKPSGSAKAATEASKIDQYLVTLQKDAIKKEDDASPVVLPGISKEVPTFTPMPMVYDLVMFNEIAENNAKMYNDYYNELSIRYIGRVGISIADASLSISKEGRGVYAIFKSKLSCFGTGNCDMIRVNAKGLYPDIIFTKDVFYFPIYEVEGNLIGRKVTEIEIEVKRHRPKWLDKHEGDSIIRLSTFIPQHIIMASFEEQVHIMNEKQKEGKGYMILEMKYETSSLVK